jgi:murein DD-endopeptidase MepM/ murein hydrolase activator NlpD
MTRRQMARRVDAPRRRPPVPAIASLAVVGIVGLMGAWLMFGRASSPRASSATAGPTSPVVAVIPPSPTPSARSSAQPTPKATSVAPTSTPNPTPVPTSASSGGGGSTTPVPNGAPTSAASFDVHNEVVDIAFPLRSDTNYHYRDNWYQRRDGPPDAYNHAKTLPNGSVVRLHDGIDIYAPQGEPVLAPFDGVVIDPRTKWTPWHPDRYGLTVVILSDEKTSPGYTAILVHLDKVWVETGQHVTRGQVIGALGRTGDAQEVAPQLHFELRAPFLINWSALGEDRMVDAFNPYPSLVAADPRR